MQNPLPETAPEQAACLLKNRARALSRGQRWTAAFAFCAVGLLIGVVVILFLFEFSSISDGVLVGLLIGFLAGIVVCSPLAFALSRLSVSLGKRCDDAEERSDSPESFFVGEGTLATFGEDGLVLHSLSSTTSVTVPYGEVRFFSVCTRRAPAEKGTWSVAIEIPARYLSKTSPKGGEPPVLIQADLKPRLLEALSRHGLELIGDRPAPKGKNVHFTPLKKFALPNARKRKIALIILGMGAAVAVAGVPAAIFWNLSAGAIFLLLGLFVVVRQTVAYMRARALFVVYKEGVYWRESEGPDRMFLKWEEIERISAEELEREGVRYPVLTVGCLYGDYRFPRPKGAMEYLAEVFPEKLGL